MLFRSVAQYLITQGLALQVRTEESVSDTTRPDRLCGLDPSGQLTITSMKHSGLGNDKNHGRSDRYPFATLAAGAAAMDKTSEKYAHWHVAPRGRAGLRADRAGQCAPGFRLPTMAMHG